MKFTRNFLKSFYLPKASKRNFLVSSSMNWVVIIIISVVRPKSFFYLLIDARTGMGKSKRNFSGRRNRLFSEDNANFRVRFFCLPASRAKLFSRVRPKKYLPVSYHYLILKYSLFSYLL